MNGRVVARDSPRLSLLLLLATAATLLALVAAEDTAPPTAPAPAPSPDEDVVLVVTADDVRGVTAARNEGRDAFDLAPAPGPALALDCSTIEGVAGGMPGVDLFYELAKRSGLESMVVPGGVFHEVAGDVTVFAPEDAALERELAFFARVFALTVAEVKRDAPLLQEILRQFVAYGDARLGDRRGVFVTLDGSAWRWGDPKVPGDGVSEIALVPVGVQLDEPPVVFEVDDDAGARSGCSRGLRLSRIIRHNVRARSAIRRARRRDVRAYYERGFGSRR